jgi:hypothetical protein
MMSIISEVYLLLTVQSKHIKLIKTDYHSGNVPEFLVAFGSNKGWATFVIFLRIQVSDSIIQVH